MFPAPAIKVKTVRTRMMMIKRELEEKRAKREMRKLKAPPKEKIEKKRKRQKIKMGTRIKVIKKLGNMI